MDMSHNILKKSLIGAKNTSHSLRERVCVCVCVCARECLVTRMCERLMVLG